MATAHGTAMVTPSLPLVWQLNAIFVSDPEAASYFDRADVVPDEVPDRVGAQTTIEESVAEAPATEEILEELAIDEAIEAEAKAQAVCMQTKDFRRAYEAFSQKRKPVFEGD